MTVFTFERYHGHLPLSSGPPVACDDVIYLVARRGEHEHRLGGLDVYWVLGDTYGAFADPENLELYGGAPAVAYRWNEHGHVALEDTRPPPAALFARGILIPDDEARQIGLL
ncbi:hypothetical protein [Natronococcus sp.]|uniref:hypothetical protein n=1 Tax=Natronococcus sp. TaxID=35747 RepID=UPI003A4DB6BA